MTIDKHYGDGGVDVSDTITFRPFREWAVWLNKTFKCQGVVPMLLKYEGVAFVLLACLK